MAKKALDVVLWVLQIAFIGMFGLASYNSDWGTMAKGLNNLRDLSIIIPGYIFLLWFVPKGYQKLRQEIAEMKENLRCLETKEIEALNKLIPMWEHMIKEAPKIGAPLELQEQIASQLEEMKRSEGRLMQLH